MIRHILNSYNSAIPTVIEIPSKDKPYRISLFSLCVVMMLLVIVSFVKSPRCLALKICKVV